MYPVYIVLTSITDVSYSCIWYFNGATQETGPNLYLIRPTAIELLTSIVRLESRTEMLNKIIRLYI